MYGHPIVGAVAGVMPDLVLGVRRRQRPNPAYRYTHSLLVCVVFSGFAIMLNFDIGLAIFMGWLLHIVVDIPTHGNEWAPRPLYPFNTELMFNFPHHEWEFFNESWCWGLILSIGICIICVL